MPTTTATTPITHSGQSARIAPSTNAVAPAAVRPNAASGATKPGAESVGFCAATRGGGRTSIRAGRGCGRLRRRDARGRLPQHPREAKAEECPPPLPDERLRGEPAAGIRRLGDLRGGVAGGRERPGEPVPRRTAAPRRADPDEPLREEVEPVLEALELVHRAPP